MSTDSIHNAFRGMNLTDSQHDPNQHSQQHQHQHSYTTPPRKTNPGSLRSPTISTSDLHNQPYCNSHTIGVSHPPNSQSPASLGQSAAARFERFFPSSPNTTASNPSSAGQTFTSSMGSAAGLAANSAFGSFGHSLAPGSMAGSSISSSQFGSNNNGPRKASSRAAIPSQWSAQDPASFNPPSAASPPKNASGIQSYQQQLPDGMMAPGDDDVIPTAIVVKNIPFSVKREQLLQIIEDLGIPMPYAFNYHFDQGIFRGLAFANFRSAEEADAVVAALNGFDVSGRKLRVEYKKVLQAGEKERIEKEKAIKRMQSMQLEKERERERRRHQDEYAANAYLMPNYNGSAAHLAAPDAYPTDPDVGLQQGFDGAFRAPLTADSLRKVPSSQRLATAIERPNRPSSSTSNPVATGSSGAGVPGTTSAKKEELDLNDAATLEIYSRVLLFKDDRMRDELSFSRTLTPLERRTVHLVAQRLGLFHYSLGEGEERCAIVTKNEVNASARPLRSQASTIGRTQRSTGLDGASTGGFLGPGSAATTGRAGLRLKKSAPDMKRGDGLGGYTGSNGYLGAGSASLAARKSNSNLRDGYSSTMGRRTQANGTGGAAGLQSLFASPFDVPAVPLLPNSGDANSHNSSPTHQNLLRQPRGPPTPGSSELRNFAVRSRVATSTNASASPSNGFQIQINGSPTKEGHGSYATSLTEPDEFQVEATTHSPFEF
ncbi:related to PIN4 - protein involved in G2/M phase progression and response to DNA damage [Melanopsichium pennsylvanicum]|uniref:Related to PIN4 - protein involved in G2/M phase progression and response to DNA damage n=2 Tax=Melanopsichium pennsylvanicum TaxID=63383 RepID=A0AAJ4XNV6_9BASI|nr:related to PIN4 - protein involved in G2/M phase progression and response to DNA damage [Melanopsichium pennsylvanicum]